VARREDARRVHRLWKIRHHGSQRFVARRSVPISRRRCSAFAAQRWPIGRIAGTRWTPDYNLPRMIWFGIEPMVAENREGAALLRAARCCLSRSLL
jgi:hypothetical protein